MGAENIVAVDLTTNRDYKRPDDIIDVLSNTFDIGLNNMIRQQIKENDVQWIQPSLSAYNKADTSQTKKLIEEGTVDVMIAISSNFFYTVALPVTLWFLDKRKKDTERKDKVLFVDARETYTQLDRAHREFTEEQIKKIAGIVRAYREEEGAEKYEDISGLCKVATIKEIKDQGFSLNPGRYVGVADEEKEDENFEEKIGDLNNEFQKLTQEAHGLEEKISENIKNLLKN
jgi:type I restriction enzyme M protein